MPNDPARNRLWVERELAFIAKRVTALEEGLVDLASEERLPLILDGLDALEAQVERLRQLRAGAVIDLRLPGVLGGRAAHTWPAVAALTGREVTPQAVQQWADQYRGAPAEVDA